MEWYFFIKFVHILSSTLLFGTGLGSAFYLWRAHRTGDVNVMLEVSKNVILADWIFTTPAVFVQPISGVLMLHLTGVSLLTPWVLWSVVLFVFVGCCWLPVVWIQLQIYRQLRLLRTNNTRMDATVHGLMRWWYTLGWPAFISVIIIFYLMIAKPSI